MRDWKLGAVLGWALAVGVAVAGEAIPYPPGRDMWGIGVPRPQGAVWALPSGPDTWDFHCRAVDPRGRTLVYTWAVTSWQSWQTPGGWQARNDAPPSLVYILTPQTMIRLRVPTVTVPTRCVVVCTIDNGESYLVKETALYLYPPPAPAPEIAASRTATRPSTLP